MEFITGKCPKCSGELQIPSDREQIICMYCGEEIDVRLAVDTLQELQTVDEEKKAKHREYAQQAINHFPQMLFDLKDPLKDFKKKTYEGSFRNYVDAHKETMDAIEDAYLTSDNAQELLKQVAEAMVSEVKEQMAAKKKRQQEDMILTYNMSLVIYVNPALRDYNRTSGTLLAEEVLRQWKAAFPKTNLKISSFEEINSGFKRRFCYITTAVCENLGKPDDCYELNLLRDYRDNYLQQTDDGEQMVQRYYDVAPTIVKHINKNSDRDRIYQEIWQDYLLPCISLIENNEKEKCQVLYQTMVNTLAQQYFNN